METRINTRGTPNMTIRSIFTYEQNTVPTIDVEEGDLWLNPDTQAVSQYTNSVWTNMVLINISIINAQRGVFGTSAWDGSFQYITIATTGNATAFGSSTLSRQSAGAASNGMNGRGVFAGGWYFNATTAVMEYVTISTIGNAISFGNLTAALMRKVGTSNGTNNRGVFGGGNDNDGTNYNTIDYITISTIGNATSSGTLLSANSYLSATSNGAGERGVFGGGDNGGGTNVIQYITISTTGNATLFGRLMVDPNYGRMELSATSNGTNNRAIFSGGRTGGNAYFNTIEYITISTTGNATNFGNLLNSHMSGGATSNATSGRAIIAGGRSSAGGNLNTIEYLSIATLGNSTNFGTLLNTEPAISACSNA